jgi:hypothetical protein
MVICMFFQDGFVEDTSPDEFGVTALGKMLWSCVRKLPCEGQIARMRLPVSSALVEWFDVIS